jgi:hypothetical protein
MKNTYSATIKMNSPEQLARFIEEIGPLVESVVITTTPVERFASAAPAKAAVAKRVALGAIRGSKVNDTIVTALQNGPTTVKELKQALEAAGLSPGSLSTGIAHLQRSGEIERVGEGSYAIFNVPRVAE